MVSNLINNNGRAAANQFVINEGNKIIFQSYATKICEVNNGSAVIAFDSNALNYSRTTSKHLYIFLNQIFNRSDINRAEVESWIKAGKMHIASGFPFSVKTW